MKKIFLLLSVMLLSLAGVSQTYVPSQTAVNGFSVNAAGTVLTAWASVDTTAQMQQLNDCTPPGPPPKCYVTYFTHTGTATVTIKNKAGAVLATQTATQMGAKTLVSVSVPISSTTSYYVESDTSEYCPVCGCTIDVITIFWWIETASTRVDALGHTPVQNQPTQWMYSPLATACTILNPDFTGPNQGVLQEAAGYVAFDLDQLMFSWNGHQPWTPITVFPYVTQMYKTDPGLSNSCTSNP